MRSLLTSLGILVVLAIVFLLFGPFYTIGASSVGVVTRFGQVVSTSGPGLGFKTPFVNTVYTISTQPQAAKIKLAAYSKDQQPADMEVTVTFHAVPSAAGDLYAQYRDIQGVYDRFVEPRTLEAVKTVFGGYVAQSAIQDRGKLNADTTQAIVDMLKSPLIAVDGVQITNIDFSDAYEQAVEARMTAQVEVEKSRQKVQNEQQLAQITVTQAQAQADSALAVAKAKADATRLAGEAEAAAIKAKGDALRDNPNLVTLMAIEKWQGQVPTTMVPGAALPFIGVK